MTRRLTTLLLLAVLLITSSVVPGIVLGTDPAVDGSVTSSSGRVLPPLPAELEQPSVHAEMLAGQGAADFDFGLGGEPTIVLDANGEPALSTQDGMVTAEQDGSVGTLAAPLTTAGLPNGLRKEVFGFLPYWMLTASALDDMNYSLVSTIAYFSVGLRADGYLAKGTSTGWVGWNSSAMTQVIDRAHANGVKVVLTVTHMAWNGDYSKMSGLLKTSAYRNRAVSQIVAAVTARGADGVNLDFEPVPTSLREEYVAFTRQLKAALSAAGAGRYLTVSVMAGAATWATGYDVPGLTASGAADALFVMGYDYHWSGSSRAGGVAPVESPYTIDVNGTMLDFLAETSGSKIIWGVPYYGRTWPTDTGALNSTTRSGTSKAHYYTGHLAQAAQYGRRWDDVGKVPWYRWKDANGNWFQGYYDDVASLGVKYDLVNARGLRGTGMWTLLMDQDRNDLWRLLARKFVNDTAPPAGGISLLPSPVDDIAVDVSWRAIDYASGVDRYNVQVRRAGEGWATWISGTTRTSATYTAPSEGTYEFRVQAIDLKGNRQPWISVPGRPAQVQAGAFAQVTSPTLNVRSGPSTGHAVVSTAVADDFVYVIEGPVSGSGYQWYRVQYGFTEWPSADYPRIGWMALGSGGEAYLVPSRAPTVTKLVPFVRNVAATSAFSPNGDGHADTASITFDLRGDTTSARLEIVNAAGSVIRSLDLGARPAGVQSASWNGRTASGAVAPEGTYLPRIVAVDGSGTHVGPAAGVTADSLAAYGMRVDVTSPTIVSASPAIGTTHAPASAGVAITFSEAMHGVGASDAYLTTDAGTRLPALNRLVSAGRRLEFLPPEPLPTDAAISVRLTGATEDVAGNPLGAATLTFRTAPGETYAPVRSLVLEPGRHTAYRFGTDARLESAKSGTFSKPGKGLVGHRARIQNLPGRWLYVQKGTFGGMWLRESALDHLRGETERVRWGSGTQVLFAPGSHTGYRFDAAGNVTATRTRSLPSKAFADVNSRRIINGRAYFWVMSGTFRWYLVPESSRLHRRGVVDRIDFPGEPPIVLEAGAHTGYRYRSNGTVAWRVTASLGSDAVVQARAWAVINGRPHFLVDNGTWAGTWVPESAAVRMDV